MSESIAAELAIDNLDAAMGQLLDAMHGMPVMRRTFRAGHELLTKRVARLGLALHDARALIVS